MQDLRESGNLEQDAHCVLLLYRPVDGDGEWTGEDAILCGKQREGVTGHVDVVYDAKTLTFEARSLAKPVPVSIAAGRTGAGRR